MFLARNPVCMAENCNKPAADVDHKIPVSGPDDPRFYDMNELQALCHCCHSSKTCRKDGGFGHG